MTQTRLDAEVLRKDFPILQTQTHGNPLVYLDSAASAQKPRAVIERHAEVYRHGYANIHRGVYELSQQASRDFDASREQVRAFLGAREAREIVFVRGTTEAINLVAATFGRTRVGAGDEVLVSALEHHSNLVPWQMLCEEKGAKLVVAPIDARGALVVEEFERRLGPRTRLVALAHVSNALGSVLPVADLIRLAHARGIPVLLDGAQAVPHLGVDVTALDCDFYALSAHKLYGPSGVGVLYGKAEHLEAMPPYQGGGGMIASVTFDRTTYAEIPHKFEAGTPDVAGVIAFGAALDYVQGIGLAAITAHEHELLEYATAALSEIAGLRILGTAPDKAAVISFVLDGIHPHDVGTILDREGIAIRAGHHCAQPVMAHFGVPATARASFGLYNTRSDVDALMRGLRRVREVFA